MPYLEEFSHHYLKNTGHLCEEIVITDAWINKANKNATLTDHLHTNSYISGTYFINYDPSIHSKLCFLNDRLLPSVGYPKISIPKSNVASQFNITQLFLGCGEGQVAIWKSQMVHGFTEPNPSDNRITLSFKVMPKICTDGQTYSFAVIGN